VKARKVKGLEPAAPLADNAQRIIEVRLDELCSFMPRAADPDEVEALHDMRIAAKRLRYILEITHPCFGSFAERAVRQTKDLQDVLGEIHDCDVQIPEVAEFLDGLVAEDAAELAARAGDAPDLDPAAVARARHRRDHAGLVALLVHLHARRRLLFARFLELWQDYERKGYRARLEYAVRERAGEGDPAGEVAPAASISGG
jgi:CHAD domain